MRDEPFLVAGMRHGRKFDGGMRDRKGSGGRREVGYFHNQDGMGELLGEMGCKIRTPVFYTLTEDS